MASKFLASTTCTRLSCHVEHCTEGLQSHGIRPNASTRLASSASPRQVDEAPEYREPDIQMQAKPLTRSSTPRRAALTHNFGLRKGRSPPRFPLPTDAGFRPKKASRLLCLSRPQHKLATYRLIGVSIKRPHRFLLILAALSPSPRLRIPPTGLAAVSGGVSAVSLAQCRDYA